MTGVLGTLTLALLVLADWSFFLAEWNIVLDDWSLVLGARRPTSSTID